jgi:hypothetical protein
MMVLPHAAQAKKLPAALIIKIIFCLSPFHATFDFWINAGKLKPSPVPALDALKFLRWSFMEDDCAKRNYEL